MVRISQVLEANEETVSAVNRLLPQLSTSARKLDISDLAEMLAADTALLTAHLDEDVVGTLTLVFYRIPTGLRARIEDVVVDEAARGHGVGRALTRAAVEAARSRGARTVDLTSRPTRVAANRLYQTEGFELRESSSYRLAL